MHYWPSWQGYLWCIAILVDDATLYSKWSGINCGNILNWLLDLNRIYETLDWGKKWLLDFNAGKTQLVSFDRSNNTGSINVKLDGSVLEEKSTFKILGFTFYSELDWDSYIVSIAKTVSKKIGALIRSMKFLFPDVAL